MVAILGSNLPVQRLVNQLKNHDINAEAISPSLHDIRFKKKIENHKVIHYIGSPTVTIHGILTLIRFKIWKKKIVVSWRGSDVMIANNNLFFRLFSKILQVLIDSNNAYSPSLVAELKNIGIKSQLQPNPTFENLYHIRKLPNEKRIAVYLPDKMSYQWRFFQGDLIKKLVKDFPRVKFIIVGNSGKRFSEKNVKCFEWVNDMEKFYSEVIGVIRIPLHDGLSNTILEATSMGRTVIAWNVDFSFCISVNSYSEIQSHLKDLVSNPSLNIEGSQYIHRKYDKEKLTSELIAIYRKLSE